MREWIMKRRNSILTTAVIAALAIVGLGATAHAQAFRSGDNPGVRIDETVNSTIFVSGRTIDIAGTVNGDVFCAGQNVTISGTVNGDVMCAGQTVRIGGTVNGDVRAAGQSVTLGAQVSNNASIAGQSLTTEQGSTIGGDASIGGQDVTLNGRVGRDLFVGSTTAAVNGDVARNVTAAVERLSLGSKSIVGGRVDYTSHNQLQRDAGAQVAGQVRRSDPPQKTEHPSGGSPWLFGLYLLVSMVTLAMVTVLFIPHIYDRATFSAKQHVGKTLLVGFVGSIVGPVVFIGLLCTVIGIPLVLLFLSAWTVLLILSGPFAAFLLGRYLLRSRSDSAIWTMLLGAVVLVLIYLIPVLGWIVALVALWFGLGMLLLELSKIPRYSYRMGSEPRHRKAASPPETTTND